MIGAVADIAVKRAILDDCVGYLRCGLEIITDGFVVRTLHRLASAWSDHPDYQRSWKAPTWPGQVTGREAETW